MNINLKEYKLKNGTTIPEQAAKQLAELSSRLDIGIAKLKADIVKARSNRDNK